MVLIKLMCPSVFSAGTVEESKDAKQLGDPARTLSVCHSADDLLCYSNDMETSPSVDTAMHQGRTGPSATPKSLAFSIDRIMSMDSQSSAERPQEKPERKLQSGLCCPVPCMIPLQPASYDLQAKAMINYSELLRDNFRGHCYSSIAALCKGNCGSTGKAAPSVRQPLLTSRSRMVKPQVLHQAVALPGTDPLYYLNCLNAAYQQSELLHGHWTSAAQPQDSLSAHYRLFLLENAKLTTAVTGSHKLPTSQHPHRQHLSGQVGHTVKENHGVAAEKSGVKTHNKLCGGSTDGKPKNFTCEVCGKVTFDCRSHVFLLPLSLKCCKITHSVNFDIVHRFLTLITT